MKQVQVLIVVVVMILVSLDASARADEQFIIAMHLTFERLSDYGDTAEYKVTQITTNQSILADAEIDTLVFECPTREFNYWKASMQLGRIVSLRWKEKELPTRGSFFRGGEPGVASIEVPSSGLPVECDCDSKIDIHRESLYMSFLDDDYQLTDAITVQGADQSFLQKRVPFKRGSIPRPPAELTILASWHKIVRLDGMAESDMKMLIGLNNQTRMDRP